VMLQTIYAELQCSWALKHIPCNGTNGPDLRAFYTIAASFVAEGVGSACYHVCPAVETFQFDTCFMIPIAHLFCTALAHWPKGLETDSRIIKYFLFIVFPIWGFNFVGTWYDVKIATETGNYLGIYMLFALLVVVWSLLAVQGFDYFFEQHDTKGCCWLNWCLKVIVVGTLTASMAWSHVRKQLGGMANTFLLLSCLMMIVIIGFQVVKLEVLHIRWNRRSVARLVVQYSYLVPFFIITKVALGCFSNKVVQVAPGKTPAESHSSNQPCVFGVFDEHDIWHALSALGLALFATMLLDVKVHSFARDVQLVDQTTDEELEDSTESAGDHAENNVNE